MIVVDASVIAPALGDDGPSGDLARRRLGGSTLCAPEMIDLEVASVFRRLRSAGALPTRRALLALADLDALPLRRVPHRPLLTRCWELAGNVTIYDAAYVALAEQLGTVLLTADVRLARAPGPQCPIEVLTLPSAS